MLLSGKEIGCDPLLGYASDTKLREFINNLCGFYPRTKSEFERIFFKFVAIEEKNRQNSSEMRDLLVFGTLSILNALGVVLHLLIVGKSFLMIFQKHSGLVTFSCNSVLKYDRFALLIYY